MKCKITLAAGLAATALAGMASSSAMAQIHWTPEVEADIAQRIESGEFQTITSVLILHNGETVYEAYFNGADANTRHDTRSVTKTITGQIAGAAVADGLLSMERPVADYFPEMAIMDARKRDIRIEDLLTMSGPLECDDWNQFSRGNEERMYLVEDWPAFYWGLPIRGFPAWASPPSESFNNRAFSYCTAGVQILGEAIERAVGEPILDYARDRLFGPLGVTGVDWPRTASGRPHLGGGLQLSARELASFAELQRNDGMHDGERLLPEAWTDRSITPLAEIPGVGMRYGYLWWLEGYEVDGEAHEAAVMNGNGGNRVWVLDEFGLTIVLTKSDYNTQGMHQAARAFFDAAIVPNLGH